MANNLITVTGIITALRIEKFHSQTERLHAVLRVDLSKETSLTAGIVFSGKPGEHLSDRFHPGDTVSAVGRVEAIQDGASIRFDNLSVVPAETPHRKQIEFFGYVRKADYNDCEDYNIRQDGGDFHCRVWVAEKAAERIGLNPKIMAAVSGTYDVRRCRDFRGSLVDRIYVIPDNT